MPRIITKGAQDLVQHEEPRPRTRRLIPDSDSSESPVHGGHEQSAYNGPVKTGGRLIRHARYFILQLAESHLTSRLFGQILVRIERPVRQQRRDATQN